MSRAPDRDLERWEQGDLSMSELLALHGSNGAAGLVVLHRRLSALRSRPVGDPEAVWRAIRERLPDLAGPRRTAPLRRRLTRPLAIAAAAVLIAGTAYAGSPDVVQRYLTSFWHRVQAILDVDVAGNAPADVDRPSQGGGQGDGPAGAVADVELEDRDEDDANQDGGETSESDGGAHDDEPDDDEGDEPDDDEGNESDDGEGDEPNDEGNELEDDEEEDEDEDPRDEDDPDGSGGRDDEDD